MCKNNTTKEARRGSVKTSSRQTRVIRGKAKKTATHIRNANDGATLLESAIKKRVTKSVFNLQSHSDNERLQNYLSKTVISKTNV